MDERDIDALAAMLSAPRTQFRSAQFYPAAPVTREVERAGDVLSLVADGDASEGAATDFLKAEGLNPDEWEVTGFRRSTWGDPGSEKSSTRFTYKRAKAKHRFEPLPQVDLDQLLNAPPVAVNDSSYGSTFIICVADTQLGKLESNPVDTVAGVKRHIDACVDRIKEYEYPVDRVVVAWLGDHIEGFVSQGGANAWRTTLPLSEQIRLMRRLMIYALQRVSEVHAPITMLAVPSNHGQAVRFNNKGTTTYDDDHCVEALLSVMDGAQLSGNFGHVSWVVPERDDLSVSVNLSGTHTVFNHGHMAKPGRLMDWVKGMAFNRNSIFHGCDLVVLGHHHHLTVDTSTDRMVVACPSGESESTWWRLSSGEGGDPSMVLLRVAGGSVDSLEVIR